MMTHTEQPSIGIIGAGNLGLALAVQFASRGHIVRLGSRDPEQTACTLTNLLPRLSEPQSQPATLSLHDYTQAADVDFCLLTVTDDLIAPACAQLIDHFKSATVVAHCSGAKSSAALSSAKAAGLGVCSLHPLNTFPNQLAGLELLSGQHDTALYCEGDDAALEQMLTPFNNAGFVPHHIATDDKVLYHAASVFACNYLTTLMGEAQRSAALANLDVEQFWSAVLPLVQATLGNISQHGPAQALSGPVARGDLTTLQAHLAALQKADPELADSYAEQGLRTLSLATGKGNLEDDVVSRIEHLLKQKGR